MPAATMRDLFPGVEGPPSMAQLVGRVDRPSLNLTRIAGDVGSLPEFAFTSRNPSTGKVVASGRVLYNPGTRVLEVLTVGTPNSALLDPKPGVQAIGTTGVRHILKQLGEAFPGATSIVGLRSTGSRAKAGAESPVAGAKLRPTRGGGGGGGFLMKDLFPSATRLPKKLM